MIEKPTLFSGPMVRAILQDRKTQTRRIVKWRQLLPDADYNVTDLAHNVVRSGLVGHQHGEWHFDRRRVPARQNGDRETFAKAFLHEVGDTLWVREAWRTGVEVEHVKPSEIGYTRPVRYEADQSVQPDVDGCAKIPTSRFGKLRPGMFMPRWASRITLRITRVKVERLQSISEADAKAEGLGAITKDGKLIKYGIADRDGLPGQDNDGWPWVEWNADPRLAYRKLWNAINGPGSWDANPWVAAYTFERIR